MVEQLKEPMLINTGDVDHPVTVAHGIEAGYAPDNELYTFAEWPEFTRQELKGLQGKNYATVFYGVTKKLLGNSIPDAVQRRIAAEAYSHDNFDFDEDGNLRVIELPSGMRMFGLSDGPSGSFKDKAMAGFIPWSDYISHGRPRTYLNDSTGDTASAGQAACSRFPNIELVVQRPKGGVSPFQDAQMKQYAAEFPDRMHVLDVVGGFSYANDLHMEADLVYDLGAINSANIARIIAQQAYHVFAYLKSIELDGKEIGDPVDMFIQSGNFGNASAAIIAARKMGLPLGNIYVVTNENNTLDIFFRDHVLRKFDKELPTTSSAQDIANPSNLWRYMFMLYGNDPEKQKITYDMWKEFGSVAIDNVGVVDETLRKGVISKTVYHHQREAATKQTFKDTNGQVILDPHTANVVAAFMDLQVGGHPIGYETAKPFKFDIPIKRTLGVVATRPLKYEGLEERYGGMEVPKIANKEDLFAYLDEHTQAKRK